MIGVEIDKQAIANIIKRIDSKFAEPAMQATIKSMGTYGYGLAKKYLKPEDEARSADYAPKSMRYDVMPLEAKIYSVMAEHRARSIEQGRAPGETLPIKAVYRWYNGTLYVRNTTIEGMGDDERRTLYKIRSNIKRMGVKGKRFIGKTWDKLIADMPDRLDRVAKQIEKRWRG